MDINERIEKFALTKRCTVSPDGDSNESKTVDLIVRFDGVLLRDVFAKAMSSTVISWQTKGRKHYTSLVDGGRIEINFGSPARIQVDPETATISFLQSMNPEDREKWIAEKLATK